MLLLIYFYIPINALLFEKFSQVPIIYNYDAITVDSNQASKIVEKAISEIAPSETQIKVAEVPELKHAHSASETINNPEEPDKTYQNKPINKDLCDVYDSKILKEP